MLGFFQLPNIYRRGRKEREVVNSAVGGAVTIEHDGRTFVGTYAVKHDVLELWTIGNDVANALGQCLLS
jgi:hypothetical protein